MIPAPIKYVVKFRISAHEDAAPVYVEKEVVATSVQDAVMQAGLILGGSFIDTQQLIKTVNLEHVGPANTVRL